ncbi:MAG TPA: prefoldin subunit alpha [Candidatus Nanoarchaeia archaeon]|nr:prefoldin subunit alpha [Candidatus Nanoarchaeia archaeon]
MKQDEKKQQELMYKFAIFEQQIQQIQEQIRAIDHAITESSMLSGGLEELKGTKDKEIFASIGKGIFIRGKTTSDELLVDVGGRNFVDKTVDETKEMIGTQIEKFESVKTQLEENLEMISKEVESALKESDGLSS